MQELIDTSLVSLWQARINRARGVARLLSAVPFVRLVGLNGSIITGQMTGGSDIDLYIVTAPGRLYLGRLFVTVAVHLTGWRRYGHKIRGRVCLNRFATTEAMDITPHNDYHARVFSGLEPLWSTPGVYEDYCRANRWMSVYGYHVSSSRRSMIRPWWAALWQWIGEVALGGRLGSWLESRQKVWQQSRIRHDVRTIEPGSRVYIRENELCFHATKK